jgi:putative transcriptional regulator
MNQSEEKNQEIRKGQLLVSEPFLGDPNFERTVVLVCEHGDDGSFGFVLNKFTEVNLKDALEEINDLNASEDIKLYIGGPVEQNTLHFIHRLGDHIEGSILIAEGVWWGGNYEQIKTMLELNAISSQDIRFFIGYSGWGAGQLDSEVDEKAWIVADTVSEFIFLTPPDKLWREVLKNMGGKYKEISNYPIDPRLN